MLQNFKVTSYAIILVLFGLTLMTVSPVIAVDGDGFTVCDNMPEAASKLSCFRDLARSLRAAVEDMTTAASSQEAAVDDAEGTKEALKLQIEEISGWLKDKDARIAEFTESVNGCDGSERVTVSHPPMRRCCTSTERFLSNSSYRDCISNSFTSFRSV